MVELGSLKILERQRRRELRRERPDAGQRAGIAVNPETGESAPEKVDEIASVAAPRIEYACAAIEPAPQDLIEEIDVDLAERGSHLVT